MRSGGRKRGRAGRGMRRVTGGMCRAGPTSGKYAIACRCGDGAAAQRRARTVSVSANGRSVSDVPTRTT